MSSLSMSQSIDLSLEILPVELLYQILDYLDAETIRFIVRSLSRFFQALVHSFQGYVFDFQSISKKNFHLLCRFIDPASVISLSLSDKQISGQINLFNSIVNLQQFTRLRSLTLIAIDEEELNFILECNALNSLSLFSLNEGQYSITSKRKTMMLLSSVIAQPRLRQLELNLTEDRIRSLSWPENCTIEYLTIHHVNLDDMCTIVSNCPCLKKVIIKDYLDEIVKNPINKRFEQLHSLTIERFGMIFESLEFVVCSFPSLKYLKLIGEESILDGQRWEELIQTKFPQLDRFEFFFRNHPSNNPTIEQLQTIISSFQRPFWIQSKQWFVSCQCNRDKSTIDLHSIPICTSVFHYDENLSEQLSLSSSTENNASNMKCVTSLDLALMMENDFGEKKEISRTEPLCSQAIELSVYFDFTNSFPSMVYFSSFVDTSKITRLKLYSSCFDSGNAHGLIHVIQLFEEQENLSSLTIDSVDGKSGILPYLNLICRKLPIYIKHLSMLVHTSDQTKTIFRRCPLLLIMEFHILNSCSRSDIIKWVEQNTIDPTFSIHDLSIGIWVGRRIVYANETRYKNKNKPIE